MQQRPSHRISVFNFDAVEQSRVWRVLGAVEATKVMLGAFRTAVLLADEVVVDRNQLLDGIFFVAMTPDRLAWHLGLEPGAKLPLTVNCQPLPEVNSGEDTVPSHTVWAPDNGSAPAGGSMIDALIDYQYAQLSDRFRRVSSSLIALSGDYDRYSTAGEHDSGHSNSVIVEPSGDGWQYSDPVLLSQEVWTTRDNAVLWHLIDSARNEWVDAMKHGRVEVSTWTTVVPQIGRALKELHASLPESNELADALIDLRIAETPDEPALNASATHPSTRALVVRWLDGETVSELNPPQLPADLLAKPLAERSRAIRWWTTAYYDAICARDGLRMLTMQNVLQMPDGHRCEPDNPEVQREIAWCLRKPRRKRSAVVRDRFRRRTCGPDVVVEGEIVENLSGLSPFSFNQLASSQRFSKDSLWLAPSNKKMFDLALSVRETAGIFASRSDRLKVQFARFLSLTAIVFTLALRDAGVINGRDVWLTGLWILLAVVAGFPYADASALIHIRSKELQATVRLSDS